jgi:hypothetical protein
MQLQGHHPNDHRHRPTPRRRLIRPNQFTKRAVEEAWLFWSSTHLLSRHRIREHSVCSCSVQAPHRMENLSVSGAPSLSAGTRSAVRFCTTARRAALSSRLVHASIFLFFILGFHVSVLITLDRIVQRDVVYMNIVHVASCVHCKLCRCCCNFCCLLCLPTLFS